MHDILLALGVTMFATVLYVTGAALFIHKTSERWLTKWWAFPVFITVVFGWVFLMAAIVTAMAPPV